MDQLSNILNSLMSPINQVRNEGQNFMEQFINQADGCENLLNYCLQSQVNINLRLTAAVYLKNHIKRYWNPQDYNVNNLAQGQIFSGDRQNKFKNILLQVFLQCDPKLYPSIKENFRIICENGYGTAWPNLMKELVGFIINKNLQLNVEIYDLINGIIKRYRYEFKSTALYEEIEKTIALIGPTLGSDLTEALTFFFTPPEGSQQSSEFTLKLGLYMKIVESGMKIFLSLNHQDFAAYFEDNLAYWMSIIKGVIELPNTLFTFNSQVYGVYLSLKSKAIKNLNFYCKEYYSDFKQYHDDFINPVINVILELKPTEEYSKLLRVILLYFKTLFERKRTNSLTEDFLSFFLKNLIVPTMRITEKELEDFEDNPNNFLRIELDETDAESNKTVAISVVKELVAHYPDLNTKYITPIIANLINEYTTNPNQNYMSKIMAINLIFATVIKNFANRFGAMSLNTSNEFVHELIDSIFIKEFNQNINSHILTKIYSLKFLIFFRLQIPMDWLEGIINMVITICNLPDQKVLNDAALLTLEKILYMKDVKSTNISVCDEILKKEELYMNVINCLTEIISKEQDSFAMKCFFRTIFLTDSNVLINKIENFASITNFIVELIVKSTDSKEQYSYYFFEAIAIIMTKLQRRDPNSYKFYTEKIRQSIISMVGGSNIEVMGYGFQLVSFMMYYDVTISDLNVNLLTNVINENNWTVDNRSLFFTFATLVKISFLKFKNFFDQAKINKIIKIVNIVIEQKLFSVAFEILFVLISFFNLEEIGDSNLKELFAILVQNIPNENVTKSSQENYAKHLILFITRFTQRFGTQNLVSYFEMNHKGATEYFLNRDFNNVFELDSISKKKVVTYGICMLMTEGYSHFGINFLKSMTTNLINLLDKFYKSNILLSANDNLLIDNINFQTNSINKLQNTDVRLDDELLKELGGIDEAKIFFETIDKLKQTLNVNLITDIYDQLPKSSQDYLQRYSQSQAK